MTDNQMREQKDLILSLARQAKVAKRMAIITSIVAMIGFGWIIAREHSFAIALRMRGLSTDPANAIVLNIASGFDSAASRDIRDAQLMEHILMRTRDTSGNEVTVRMAQNRFGLWRAEILE